MVGVNKKFSNPDNMNGLFIGVIDYKSLLSEFKDPLPCFNLGFHAESIFKELEMPVQSLRIKRCS